jgi:hypothetical protein
MLYTTEENEEIDQVTSIYPPPTINSAHTNTIKSYSFFDFKESVYSIWRRKKN